MMTCHHESMETPLDNRRLDTWQPITLRMLEEPNGLIVVVPVHLPDLLPILAAGFVEVDIPARGRMKRREQMLLLRIQRPTAALICQKLLQIGGDASVAEGSRVTVNCQMAVMLPGDKEIGLLLCLPKAAATWALPEELVAAAQELVGRHSALLSRQAAEKAISELEDSQILERTELHDRAELSRVLQQNQDVRFAAPPAAPNLRQLLHLLAPGLVATVGSAGLEAGKLQNLIKNKPRQNFPPPRTGVFDVVVAGAGVRRLALITWTPHRGATPYPEIRAAIVQRLPRALSIPRLPDEIPPLETLNKNNYTRMTIPMVPGDGSCLAKLENLSLNSDFGDVAGDAKARILKNGFDAFGWYAPWHTHAEVVWGIYVDAEGLDSLACSISEDLVRSEYAKRNDPLAIQLTWALVYQYFFFRAKVEAASSWSELLALRPRYLSYFDKVYRQNAGTNDCREQALACYWSFTETFHERLIQRRDLGMSDQDRNYVQKVVIEHLDLSPPGHRRWREGALQSIWRELALEIAQACTTHSPPHRSPPIEGLLRHALPFEFLPGDIPLHFIGKGSIATALSTKP